MRSLRVGKSKTEVLAKCCHTPGQSRRVVKKWAMTGRLNSTGYHYILNEGIWVGKVALWDRQEQLCFGGFDDEVPVALPGRKECSVRGWRWSLDIR